MGRFEQAPLIYMIARLKTGSLQRLTGDQQANLEQTLAKLGFVEPIQSSLKGFSLEIVQAMKDDCLPVTQEEHRRKGFFDSKKLSAIIVDRNNGIFEYRTSNYTTFNDAANVIQQVIKAFCDVAESYKEIAVNEITLAYVDFISPNPGRELKDYFDEKEKILPLNILGANNSDERNSGSIQVSRLVKKDIRMSVHLEQLPFIKGKPIKYLPQNMLEGDTNFSMPLVKLNNSQYTTNYYALLTTESAKLISEAMGTIDFKGSASELHDLTSKAFNDLINEEVCNDDWKYV